MCHMSCVTCHVSHVMCHMSCVTCHVSHVMCLMLCVTCHVSQVMCHIVFFFVFFWQSVEAYWWTPCRRQLVQWRECSCSSLVAIYSRPRSPTPKLQDLQTWGFASSLQDIKEHGADDKCNFPQGLEEAPYWIQVEALPLSGYYNVIRWRLLNKWQVECFFFPFLNIVNVLQACVVLS